MSFPGNKVGLSSQMNNFIYKKLSAGLGYKLPNDLKISGFIDREKMTGQKGKNAQTVQLSGSLKGSKFVGSLTCLLYTSPSPRDGLLSRMPSSA